MAADDLLIGVLIGLILTLTGAGGSVVASPLLVFFSDVSINDATGLTLTAVCLSSACMAVYGYCRGMFSLRPVAMLALAGMATAPLGRVVVEHIDSRVMGIIFSLTAMSFSIYYLFGDRIGAAWRRRFPAEAGPPPGPPGSAALCGWGALAGGLSGFFGVGGGIILMPIVLKVLRVPAAKGIFHCLPAICLITSTGSLTFISYADSEILSHLLMLAVGALLGSALGLSLLPLMNPRHSLKILGVAVMVFASATLYKSLA